MRRAVIAPATEHEPVLAEVDPHPWQAGEGIPLVGGQEAAEQERGAVGDLDGADLARIEGVGAAVRDRREVLLLAGAAPKDQAGSRIHADGAVAVIIVALKIHAAILTGAHGA